MVRLSATSLQPTVSAQKRQNFEYMMQDPDKSLHAFSQALLRFAACPEVYNLGFNPSPNPTPPGRQ